MSAPVSNDCGCCSGLETETPALVGNRPGLSAVAYRCGTHAQFKESMIAALSTASRPALGELKTRDADDFSIALLDAWAVVADVLSFYQERIAQESFLRTATERRSLLDLARLIGYELQPGVAASAHLAFTLDELPGAPKRLTLEPGTRVQSVPGPGEKPQTFETVEKFEARAEWNAIKARMTKPQDITASTAKIHLKGVATNLKRGDVLLFMSGTAPTQADQWALRRVKGVMIDPTAASSATEQTSGRTTVELEQDLAGFNPTSAVQVFSLRQRAALFGHNAPDPHVLAWRTVVALSTTITPAPDEFGEMEASSDWDFKLDTNALDLDATYSAIVGGEQSWLVLLNAGTRALFKIVEVAEAGLSKFAITGKVTRLKVTITASAIVTLADFAGGKLRGTAGFAQSEHFDLAEEPTAPTVSGTTLELAQSMNDVVVGRRLAISGRKPDSKETFSQLVELKQPVPAGDFPTIEFSPAIPMLDRESVTVNANVALATHGESVAEILGSGDASLPYQRFILRQPPLTYVSGATASGAVSTLALRVNDLLWHEVPTLYGRGPRERVFVTRTGDDGRTTVQFGDGRTGARLPSGQDNVRAQYRKGLGLEGNVGAGQLTTLLTRPLGLKNATNPDGASGGDDRTPLADARRNAPLTVLTLDRVVSLQDYEDFVRNYAGVAKALATWTWDGHTRGVFVTVAGPGGVEIEMASETGRNLLAAIRAAGDPFVPVQMQSYHQDAAHFHLEARVKVDPDNETPKVLASVEKTVRDTFSFDARQFGQPVFLSEVIAAIQSVAGVVAVDVEQFRLAGATNDNFRLRFFLLHFQRNRVPAERLLAALPQAGGGGVLVPAQLLTLEAGPLKLEVMP